MADNDDVDVKLLLTAMTVSMMNLTRFGVVVRRLQVFGALLGCDARF